jgi:hypothetical protein
MKNFFYVTLGLFAFCFSSVSAQDIILLDQNGEKVGVAKVGEKKEAAKSAKIVIKKDDKQPADKADSKGKVKATMANGVITIVNEDGSIEEINLADAQSVMISRSSKSVVGEDGKPQMKSTGKAILIGPDGVRREIVLDEDGSSESSSANRPKTWMIGVSVQPVSSLLRTHLKLDDGGGLVVTRVFRGGAAERAGILKDDILLFADQKLIGDRKQLAEVVNEAGADGSPLTFTILRSGDETSISVEATEREGMGGLQAMDLNIDALGGLNGLDGLDLEFKQFGPGIIIGDGGEFDLRFEANDRINDRLKQMQQQMDEVRRALRGEDK